MMRLCCASRRSGKDFVQALVSVCRCQHESCTLYRPFQEPEPLNSCNTWQEAALITSESEEEEEEDEVHKLKCTRYRVRQRSVLTRGHRALGKGAP